jgi:CubicO group peptidase (beta-lactamase class C family)
MDISSPSEQGVDPMGISRFLDAVEDDPRIEPHGLVVQRHGRRIAEGYWAPHTADRIRLVYSLSKTFTGTALGLQLGEGRLSLDDLVREHLPDLFDETDPMTQRLRIRHIASMASGHDRETFLEAVAIDPADPLRGFFKIPPDAEPGTLFAYNQPPVIALATILQGLAGERLTEYLRPRVLDPLGIGDLRWTQLRPGIDMGFSGVHTNLDAVARLGQLHLDDGVWEGRRILPAGWVAEASAVQIANPQREEPDWRQGYGFQLWRSRHGYRGDGAFGQYMLVLPEHDAVVAMFSCTEDMQVVLDLVWEHLLPAMGGDPSPPSPADEALAARLRALKLPTAVARVGGGSPDVAPMVFGPGAPAPGLHRTVTRVETVAGGRMVVHEDGTSFDVPLTADWTTAEPALAASAARQTDGRLVADVVFLATPHRVEIELDPAAGTFAARWLGVPLFGAGVDKRLASMHAPPD